MKKFEKEFRSDHPKTVGETDKEFDNANYTEWLEEKLSNNDRKPFDEIIHPVIKWLNDNGHPHMKIIVESTGAKLVEGVQSTGEILDYIKE